MLIVYTGNGKGKTSAAFGNVFRALGHGYRVLVVQFLKERTRGGRRTGEAASARKHRRLEIVACGEGFVGIRGDRKALSVHRAAAKRGWRLAKKAILSGKYGLVVLDELNIAMALLGRRAVSPGEVLEAVRKAPEGTHVVLTGRNAPAEVIRQADLVTEMKEVRHPFKKGIPAVRGIDH